MTDHKPPTSSKGIDKRLKLKPQVEELSEALRMLKVSAETGGLPDMHIENILKWYVDSVLELLHQTEVNGRVDENKTWLKRLDTDLITVSTTCQLKNYITNRLQDLNKKHEENTSL